MYESQVHSEKSMNQILIGGIELGGTKVLCSCVEIASFDAWVSDAKRSGDSFVTKSKNAFARIDTSSPQKTLAEIRAYFSNFGRLAALGVASFGPLDIDPMSSNYGTILATPKPGWSDFNLGENLIGILDRENLVFDTDVNMSARAEKRLGAAVPCDNFVYVTVGTGIGAGVYLNGKIASGKTHFELGHIPIQKKSYDNFAGVCGFHRDNCLEGLASGPAIEQRWGAGPQFLDEGHPAWDLEAEYLAQFVQCLVCSYAPEKIVFGGGVMQNIQLLTKIQRFANTRLANYLPYFEPSRQLVLSTLDDKSGLYGALLAARSML